eukprot:m.610136 g.610136  ORF g.610136 m.610136 type:complete len:420 (-) comp22494_c0_seq6:4189-5448(-)
MNKRHSSVHVSIFGAIVTYVGVFVPTPPYVSNYPVKYDVSVFWDVPYFNVSAHEKHRLDIYRPITRVSVPLKDVIPKECSSEPDGCDSSYTMEQSADSAMNELRPVLLFVHGGGWKRGSRYNWLLGFHQNIGYAFASRGIMVVNVDYRKSIGPSALGGPVTLVVCALAAHAIRRLYPKSPVGRISFARLWIVLVGIVAAFAVFPMWTRWLRGDFALYPSHQDDITAAVDWVHNSIEEYGGDPTNIILMGHSAGAHLLAMHLLKSRAVDAGETAMEQRSDGIRGSILVSGPYSGHRMGISLFRKIVFMFPVFGFDEDTWEGHFPLALTGDSEHVKQLDLPPFLFINAEYDVDLHDHTEDMVQRLARADVRAETFTVRGTTHFSVLLGLDRKFSLAESFTLPTAMDFIARVSKIQPRRIDA